LLDHGLECVMMRPQRADATVRRAGDTHKSYETLAKTMAVPQTCCLALRAPLDLPFDLGYGWYPAFNQDDGSRTCACTVSALSETPL
jgi:hypothetical protein